MKYQRLFRPADQMVELVKEDFNILPLISRFGIPLGFGNRSIDEMCRLSGIDTETFLLIVNFTLHGVIPDEKASVKKAMGIVDFLHNSHDYFLGYKFPHIRANLLEALDDSHSDINPSIIRFFDDYVGQVANHFSYEETYVWPYVKSLQGVPSGDYSIGEFAHHHEEIGEKLADLKNLILRYYTTSKPDRMYDVLVDIFNVEEDLDKHRDVENHILIPLIRILETVNRQKQ